MKYPPPGARAASINYIHMNPIKRQRYDKIDQWKWSSAKVSLTARIDPVPLWFDTSDIQMEHA